VESKNTQAPNLLEKFILATLKIAFNFEHCFFDTILNQLSFLKENLQVAPQAEILRIFFRFPRY